MFISKAVDAFASRLGLNLPPEQWEALRRYAEIVMEWNPLLHLVKPKNGDDLWIRHILESLILLPRIGDATLVDLGAGAGFLSLPLLICRPDLTGVAVESKEKRVLFLERVIHALRLPCTLHHGRVESWIKENDTCRHLLLMRALPRWQKLLPPLLADYREGRRLALFVGEGWEKSVRPLQPWWRLDEKLAIPQKKSAMVLLFSNVSRET